MPSRGNVFGARATSEKIAVHVLRVYGTWRKDWLKLGILFVARFVVIITYK